MEKGGLCEVKAHAWDDTVLQEMYRNGELCDVSLHGRGSEFACRAHRVCLAGASPVLRRMIAWEMERGDRAGGGCGDHTVMLVLPEVGAELLQIFVEFIYTGTVALDAATGGKLETITELGRLANFFDVAALRAVVEAEAAAVLDTRTCAELLGMSIECSLGLLQDRCAHFALDHFSSVSLTPGFLLLGEDVVASLLGDDRLTCSGEEEVYNAVVRWVTAGWDGPRHWDEADGCGKRLRSSLDHHGDWEEGLLGSGGRERGRALFGHVRFALLGEEYLSRRVRSDAMEHGWADVASAVDWALTLTPLERRAAAPARSGSGLSLEDLRSLALKSELRGHAGAVEALACWCPPGCMEGRHGSHLLVSGSRDGSIRLWDAETSSLRGALELPRQMALGSVYSLLVVGDKLFSGSQNKSGGPLHAWCLATLCHEGAMEGHTDAVMSLQQCGETFFSGSWDRSIREWSTAGRSCLRVYSEGVAAPVLNMMVCGRSVVFSGTSGCAQVWRLDEGAEPAFLEEETHSSVLCIAACSGPTGGGGKEGGLGRFVPHGRAVTGHRDGAMRVWDTLTWELVATIHAHSEAVSALSACGSWVVSGSSDCSLRVWDLGSRDPSEARCVRHIKLPGEPVRLMACEHGVAVTTKDRSIRTLISLGSQAS